MCLFNGPCSGSKLNCKVRMSSQHKNSQIVMNLRRYTSALHFVLMDSNGGLFSKSSLRSRQYYFFHNIGAVAEHCHCNRSYIYTYIVQQGDEKYPPSLRLVGGFPHAQTSSKASSSGGEKVNIKKKKEWS